MSRHRSPPAPPQEPIVADDPEQADDFAMLAEAAPQHRAVFARMGRNIAWVLGGRGFAGLVSLGYLALAARGMGPERFGIFTLILAYGQGIVNLVQFQSNQAVIRYGALHGEDGRQDRLAHLLGFTATVDVATALGGAVLAALGVHLAAPLLGWTGEQRDLAAMFGAALLLSTGSTPNGILRLFNRFDLITICEALAPVVRLVGSITVWATGGGVAAFLAVWAAAALLQALAQWIVALRLTPARLALGRGAFESAVAENARLWRFMLQTNLANSLGLFWSQIGVLAVGGIDGPAAAGGFRLASKLAKAIARPVQTLAGVLYPELARLVASNDRATLRKLMWQIRLISVGLSLLVVLIAAFGGPAILRGFAGPAYDFAHIYLLLFGIVAAIDLSGIGLEHLHTAHGRTGRVLGTRAIGAAVYGIALALLLPTEGALGAAIASICTALVMRVRLGVSASAILRRMDR